MTVFEIPLLPQAQKLTVSLAGVIYNLRLYFNPPSNVWLLDIADQNNNPLLSGVPLVTSGDLLEQYGYLGIGGKLVCQTDNAQVVPPTYNNLGSSGHLFFITP